MTGDDVDPTSRRDISRRLLAFGRPLWWALGLSITFRVLQMSLGIALFGIGAWGVGHVVAGGDVAVGGVLGWMVAVALAKALLRYLEQFSGHYVAFRLLAMLRNDFYARVEPQAPAGLSGRHTGDLLARVMKDIDRVEVFYAHTIAPATAATLVPLLALGYLAVWQSAVVAAVLAPFLVLVGAVVPLWSNRAASAAATDLRMARGELSQHLTDGIQGIREVLAFGHEEQRVAELGELSARADRANATTSRLMALRRGLNELFLGAGLVVVFLVGAAQVQSGGLTWGDLTVVMAVSLLAFGPVLGVEEFIADLEQAFAGARRLFEITDAPPAVTDPADPTPIDGREPSVRFRDVSFTYPGARGERAGPAVDGVDLEVAPGQRVAIVGHSGSGKSTLVSLLLRVHDVDGGAVEVGGLDVRELHRCDLRESIAVVDQRAYLFNDTIAANLRVARPEATPDQLEEAARFAELHDTIAAMPDGYDTVVGEMGERLSGGQRQRLAIARALLRDAPILVLDEATSNLDVHTEARLQATFDRLAEGRTTVVVAHRLSTVRDADLIAVMDRGRLVEQGTHDELLATAGHYARLWAAHATDLDAALAAVKG